MTLKWDCQQKSNNFGFKISDLEPNESRFHAIYFVDGISGAVLVSNQYSKKAIFSQGYEDLISSFLSAINMFIRELNNDGEEIQEINFKGTRILYERRGRLICIGISKKTDLELERQILHNILNDFYCKFEKEINRFNGIIEPKILKYKFKLDGKINTNFNQNLNFAH
ncbi:MAG: hypothetical protein ACTSQP_16345 [Promethearchaeota archaeon]